MFISSNLKFFIIVAREKSLKKASEFLFVTSSPISRRIKLFEDELGYKLFSRTNNDLTLTKKGQELYEKIMPYYEKMSEIEDSFSNKNSSLNPKRNVMIGVENLNHYIFNIIVEKREKTACISYFSSDANHSIESLLSGEVQAIISHRDIAEKGIRVFNAYSEPVGFLWSNALGNYQLSEMKNIPVLIPKNVFHNEYIKTAHMKILSQYPGAQVIIVEDLDSYRFLIEKGDAVGLMSESMLSFYKNRYSFSGTLDYTTDRAFPALKTYVYCLEEREESLKMALSHLLSEELNGDNSGGG